MKFKVGLLVVCGALLLCVTGCRSTETQSFQVTPLTQTEQNSLEQLGEQLFVAVAAQDYAAAKSLFAEDFGKGVDNKNFKPYGSSEVRRAGIAFIKMKERIQRQISERTQMLAGVSHDLRTPLTRRVLMNMGSSL